MFFILLTFATALAIEGLGSLVSVIGISSLFGANPIIIALAIALDVGKIVVVSLLYTHWGRLPFLMKSYALIAATVTMIITSGGAAGYLSGEFQKAMIGSQTNELQVKTLTEQRIRYLERKQQIDNQIAQLPANAATARIRLQNSFKAEQTRLDQQIQQIDEQLPKLQTEQINVNAKVGPILQISEFFQVPVEEATKWVILAIIFVFDPLAVFLIVAGNFLWAKRKEAKRLVEEDDDDVFDPREWGYGPPPFPPDDLPPTPKPETKVEVVETPIDEPTPEPPKREVRIVDDEELTIKQEPMEIRRGGGGLTSPIEADKPPVKSWSLEDVKADPSTSVDARARSGYQKPKVNIQDNP